MNSQRSVRSNLTKYASGETCVLSSTGKCVAQSKKCIEGIAELLRKMGYTGSD